MADSGYDSGVLSVADQAKEWIDRVNSGTGLSGGWRLQFVRYRTRRKFDASSFEPDPSVLDANGDPVASLRSGSSEDPCDELPVRIRRFVPGIPWALVDQAIRYLHRIAPYTGIVYNGVRLEGTYRPTLTMWQRDEQSLSPAERGSLGTYTLIQDLVEITECPDELLVPTASSCQAYEETKYVWDADSVEELPVTCEQGVSYSIRAVQRNEDGTYDYQLVKTVSKTSSWGPVTIECTPQQETVEWGWKNLYGEPGSGLYAVPCGSDERTLVDLPPQCDERGVLTQVQLSQNQDCTFDATVRRRTSKPYEDEWTEGTSCRPETTTAYENQLSMPPVPEAAPGETVRVQMRRNQDDTYSGTVSVRAAPEPLEYSWTDGPSCRPRTTTVLRDQVERPSVPATTPGQTLDASLERNQDCLWDARFSVTDPAPSEDITWTEGSQCRVVEAHRLLSQADYAGLVPAPGEGESVSASVERNADCTYDVSYKVQHRADVGAAPSWTDGPACRQTTHTLYVSVPEMPPVPDADPGGLVRASLSFSESDCTWSGQVSVTEPVDPANQVAEWDDGPSCQRTHHTLYVSRPGERPEIPSADPGGSVHASLSYNESDCTWSGQVSKTDPRASDVAEWTNGSECRLSYVTMSTNLPEPTRQFDVGTGYSYQARVSRNSDCTYDVTEVREVPQPWTWREDWYSRDGRHTIFRYGNQDSPLIRSDTRYIVRNDFRKDESTCLYDGSWSETDPADGGGGERDYLWGPLFSGKRVDFVGVIGDPDPASKKMAALWRVTYTVAGSRHFDDWAEDLARMTTDGWTVNIAHTGSYSSIHDSFVFTGTATKVVQGTEPGEGLVDRTAWPTFHEAVAAAQRDVEGSPVSSAPSGF